MKFKNQQHFNEQSFALKTKKHLGQHLLKDKQYLIGMLNGVKRFNIRNVDEIGPGAGALTKVFLEDGFNIKAIEKDREAFEGLNKSLKELYPNSFEVELGNILYHTPSFTNRLNKCSELACIGNIPYNITSDILLWFAKNRHIYSYGLFLMQKEVAERLIAKPNTKDFGRLSVRMQLSFKINSLFDVPPEAFIPPPKVNSAVVLLEPLSNDLFPYDNEKEFEQFVAILFSARRKMLRRSLKSYVNEELMETVFSEALHHKILETSRPDSISSEQILSLFFIIKKCQETV